jgi:hypothetical protein
MIEIWFAITTACHVALGCGPALVLQEPFPSDGACWAGLKAWREAHKSIGSEVRVAGCKASDRRVPMKSWVISIVACPNKQCVVTGKFLGPFADRKTCHKRFNEWRLNVLDAPVPLTGDCFPVCKNPERCY